MLESIESDEFVQKRHCVSARREEVAIFSTNRADNSSSDWTWENFLRHSRSCVAVVAAVAEEEEEGHDDVKGVEATGFVFDEEETRASLCFFDCKWFWYAFLDK